MVIIARNGNSNRIAGLAGRLIARSFSSSFALWFALSFTLSLSACGKKTEETANQISTTKTAEQLKAEKAASDKVVRDNPVYGDQVKALDAAKEVAKAAEAQAAEAAKKIDEATK